MPVQINNGQKKGAAPRPIEASAGYRFQNGREMTPDQVEVFGRLRMDFKQIGQYYGVTAGTIRNVMRREDMQTAYDRGRAETIVALRQKQLQMALAGSERMLIHAGALFGDTSDLEEAPKSTEEQRSRFSWEDGIAARADAVLAKLRDEGGNAA